MHYRLSHQALRDIDDITRYTVQDFGAGLAEKYLDRLFFLFDTLTDNPRMGREWQDGIRWFLYKSHRIYYRIDDEAIQILRIRHTSRSPL
jgi:toxin ParE1/3/4